MSDELKNKVDIMIDFKKKIDYKERKEEIIRENEDVIEENQRLNGELKHFKREITVLKEDLEEKDKNEDDLIDKLEIAEIKNDRLQREKEYLKKTLNKGEKK